LLFFFFFFFFLPGGAFPIFWVVLRDSLFSVSMGLGVKAGIPSMGFRQGCCPPFECCGWGPSPVFSFEVGDGAFALYFFPFWPR